MSRAQEHLEAAFGQAAPDHLAWQIAAPYVADRERDLVRAAFLPVHGRVLDLGCAEGATLIHLDAHRVDSGGATFTGVDLFEPKLAVARRHLPGCGFVAASAYALPFENASFDHVLIRDVIHHLEEPDRAIDEVARVIVPGGRVDVLEPCRYNPLIALHAITQPAERGELRSTRPFLERLVARRFRVVSAAHHQAFPIHRLVFHPRLGSPRAAESAAVRALVGAFEALAERVVPKAAWAYVHVRAEFDLGSGRP